MIPLGKIDKMYIEAYEDNTFKQKKLVGGVDRFSLLINPEAISRKYAIEYVDDQRTNTAHTGKYFRTKPEEFKIDILFDATGVVKDAGVLNVKVVNPFSDNRNDVTSQIQLLKDFCYHYEGEIHRPYFIKLCWGAIDGLFKGVMTNLDIDYKLFRPDGKPIRAVAHLNLISSIDAMQAVRLEDNRSPDITHSRTFKAGDSFTLMANNIYNTPDYYIDVAKANQMLSFRRIKQGTVINFPPVK